MSTDVVFERETVRRSKAIFGKPSGGRRVTADYESVELPQFTRQVAVIGGFDTADADHDPRGSGILRPFAGVLGLGLTTGDWPVPALSHLALGPLVADALGESSAGQDATDEATARRTVVDRTSERTVVDRTAREAPTDGRTTNDDGGEPRVRDLLRTETDGTRPTGDGADDEETFREIVERVSANERGTRDYARTGDRDRPDTRTRDLTDTADRAIPPRMDVARDVDSGDDGVRVTREPAGETGTDGDREATRLTDTTDEPPDTTPDDASDITPDDVADAVAPPERPTDGTEAVRSDGEAPSGEEARSDAHPPEPPEMTVQRNATGVAGDESDDGASAPDGSDGRATTPGEPEGRETPPGRSDGPEATPGGSDDREATAGRSDAATTPPETVASTVTRSITRLPGPPSMTVQRSVTMTSNAGNGESGTPSPRPGGSSTGDDARSTTAGPGAGSPGGTDRVTRTVLAEPLVAGAGGASGADGASGPAGATGTDGPTGGPPGGTTADVPGREALPVQSERSTPGGVLAPSDHERVRLEPLSPAGRPTGTGPRSTGQGSRPDAPGVGATNGPRMSVRHDGTADRSDATGDGDHVPTGAGERPTHDGRTTDGETPGRPPLERFVDIDRLTDRLYRAFERKLRIERERRGL